MPVDSALVLALAAVTAVLFVVWIYLRLLARRRSSPDSARVVGGTTPPRDRRWFFDNLTEREMEVAHLVAQGFHNADIARALTISDNTVESHLKSIYAKLDVHSRVGLVRAIRDLVDD